MREIIIKENEAGQRLDKFLKKYMKEAPASFFYKMLRKKNIVLNGKKAGGNEKLAVGEEEGRQRKGRRRCHGASTGDYL